MAGHSHWANIQHKKGKVDAIRGRLWSKLSRAIIIAARHGGGDPAMNLKLRYAIDKARAVSMPKDNIERAIKRGTGEGEAVTYDEITYEGYAPGGIALLVEIATDNRSRTKGEIYKIFERAGATIATPGAVAFQFEKKGLITIPAAAIDEDRLMEVILEAGADDLKREGDVYEVVTDPTKLTAVNEALARAGVPTASSSLESLPKLRVDAGLETGLKVLRLMEALEEHDDVQNVYTNLNITEELTAAAGKH
jgi:YebC/PmpR family DNA-binding regulatory protein